MRACVQRVSRAQVTVDGEVTGAIKGGLLVLLGVGKADGSAQVKTLAEKLVHLRIFNDADGKMNLSVQDVGGAVLVVSQFTLLGDCRKGRRPSFIEAAPPEIAQQLYQELLAEIAGWHVPVAQGKFQTHMHVELVNDGPVTLLIEV